MTSSKEYSVNRISRHELQYESKGKTLTLEVEESVSSVSDFNRPIGKLFKDFLTVMKARRSGLVVYLSQVQTWDAPHNSETIGEQELADIKRQHPGRIKISRREMFV